MHSAIAFLNAKYAVAESNIQIVFMELGIFIGTVTFIASIIACQKLDGKYKNVTIKGQRFWNIFLVLVAVVLMVLSGLSSYYVSDVRRVMEPVIDVGDLGYVFIILLVVISCIYGVFFVLPIGGADMPVVISVLNAFSGISGCCAGFMLKNNLLIITGASP